MRLVTIPDLMGPLATALRTANDPAGAFLTLLRTKVVLLCPKGPALDVLNWAGPAICFENTWILEHINVYQFPNGFQKIENYLAC